jgi:hypothetical protein
MFFSLWVPDPLAQCTVYTYILSYEVLSLYKQQQAVEGKIVILCTNTNSGAFPIYAKLNVRSRSIHRKKKRVFIEHTKGAAHFR